MIRYITNRIQENSDKYSSYSSVIVTNGYLLTRENAKTLKDLGVHNAQITLDGAPEAHDSRRYLKGSKGPTFMKILDNIKESYDLINISIRVNVDKTNINHIDELLDIIHAQGLKDKVTLYISPVSDTTGKPDPNCFTSKEFSREQINFYTRMINNGTEIVSVPEANYGVCSAISPFSFLVDPLGNLYKCWNDVGRIEMNVGNVFEGQKTNPVLSSYLNYNAFDNEKCHSCSVLPLCLGGCPYEKNKLGKTTLLNLISGIFFNYSGDIIINKDLDLRIISLTDFRNNLAYIPQKTDMFTGSIYDNLTMFDKEISKKIVIEKCKSVGLHDDIMQLPDKYETIYGSQGVLLSGGQMQKIGIVRALIKEHNVYLCDEIYASLDSDSADMVRNLFFELSKKAIVICIDHNFEGQGQYKKMKLSDELHLFKMSH